MVQTKVEAKPSAGQDDFEQLQYHLEKGRHKRQRAELLHRRLLDSKPRERRDLQTRMAMLLVYRDDVYGDMEETTSEADYNWVETWWKRVRLHPNPSSSTLPASSNEVVSLGTHGDPGSSEDNPAMTHRRPANWTSSNASAAARLAEAQRYTRAGRIGRFTKRCTGQRGLVSLCLMWGPE